MFVFEVLNGEKDDLTIRIAKVHQKYSPLPPVLSMLGRNYGNLNKFRSPFFIRLSDVIFETSSKEARATIEATSLKKELLIVFLNVKSFYTDVPFEEAIETAIEELYSSDESP